MICFIFILFVFTHLHLKYTLDQLESTMGQNLHKNQVMFKDFSSCW